MLLGSTQFVGEITKSNVYTETRQARSVREEGHGGTVALWRAIPQCEGAPTPQGLKTLAVQEFGRG